MGMGMGRGGCDVERRAGFGGPFGGGCLTFSRELALFLSNPCMNFFGCERYT